MLSVRPITFKNSLVAFAIGLVCLLMASFSAYADETRVLDVRYGPHADKARVVLDFTQRVSSRVTMDSAASQLHIDLPYVGWSTKLGKHSNLGPVQNITLLQQSADTIRVTFDLKRPVTLKQSFWLPASQGNNPRLVLDLVKAKSASNLNPPITAQTDIEALLHDIAHTPSNDTIKTARAEAVITNHSIIIPPRKPAELISARKAYRPVIVIDAGHGGKDPGAIAKNGQHEKDIVMKLAREMRDHLNASGRYEVRLTRDKDRFIKLRDRVAIAKKKGADIFISLHADSIPDRKVTGASVYTLSDKASDAQTAKLAARENKADLISGVDLSHEEAEVANILLDLVTRDTTNQSKFFANLLVQNFKGQGVKTLPTPHRHAGFAVLKAPDIPSVLIESGFISSPKEVEKLNNKAHRQKIVRAVEGALNAYFLRLASFRTYTP